ncbi:MAG: hypothetical protein BWK72_16230 [Rhodoferax ferrireducens]|uniref:Transmembrane protein n=1 Tax=Rhodoferax ferrireducens TaxID=192843 RepID=A0A1W9KQW6_9BURK|nr:MAG: hypothetical protein BWK72_16230 [Rhodoferax ferrireducens]
MTPQHMVAWLRYQLHRHGWPAVVGLVLIIGAVGLQFAGVEQARTRVAELRAEAVAQRQRQAQQPDPGETADKRLAAFYDSLPNADGALEAIETIHRSAGENGVKLATGEYRLVRQGSTKLQRYQINLPARASYPHLRAWLADVMNAVPTAALSDISFQREDIGSDTVEASVRLTLFLRAP